jgi:hypothetical protein
MGFGNAMGQMMGMTPPIVHQDPRAEIYAPPMSMAPNVTPTTKQADLVPQGTNISPILRTPLQDVKESPSLQDKAAQADKVSGMSVGV